MEFMSKRGWAQCVVFRLPLVPLRITLSIMPLHDAYVYDLRTFFVYYRGAYDRSAGREVSGPFCPCSVTAIYRPLPLYAAVSPRVLGARLLVSIGYSRFGSTTLGCVRSRDLTPPTLDTASTKNVRKINTEMGLQPAVHESLARGPEALSRTCRYPKLPVTAPRATRVV